MEDKIDDDGKKDMDVNGKERHKNGITTNIQKSPAVVPEAKAVQIARPPYSLSTYSPFTKGVAEGLMVTVKFCIPKFADIVHFKPFIGRSSSCNVYEFDGKVHVALRYTTYHYKEDLRKLRELKINGQKLLKLKAIDVPPPKRSHVRVNNIPVDVEKELLDILFPKAEHIIIQNTKDGKCCATLVFTDLPDAEQCLIDQRDLVIEESRLSMDIFIDNGLVQMTNGPVEEGKVPQRQKIYLSLLDRVTRVNTNKLNYERGSISVESILQGKKSPEKLAKLQQLQPHIVVIDDDDDAPPKPFKIPKLSADGKRVTSQTKEQAQGKKRPAEQWNDQGCDQPDRKRVHLSDWNCPKPSCGYLNFTYRERCLKCNTHKDTIGKSRAEKREKAKQEVIIKAPLPRPWICANVSCGAINAAEHQNCKHCSLHKDEKRGRETQIFSKFFLIPVEADNTIDGMIMKVDSTHISRLTGEVRKKIQIKTKCGLKFPDLDNGSQAPRTVLIKGPERSLEDVKFMITNAVGDKHIASVAMTMISKVVMWTPAADTILGNDQEAIKLLSGMFDVQLTMESKKLDGSQALVIKGLSSGVQRLRELVLEYIPLVMENKFLSSLLDYILAKQTGTLDITPKESPKPARVNMPPSQHQPRAEHQPRSHHQPSPREHQPSPRDHQPRPRDRQPSPQEHQPPPRHPLPHQLVQLFKPPTERQGPHQPTPERQGPHQPPAKRQEPQSLQMKPSNGANASQLSNREEQMRQQITADILGKLAPQGGSVPGVSRYGDMHALIMAEVSSQIAQKKSPIDPIPQGDKLGRRQDQAARSEENDSRSGRRRKVANRPDLEKVLERSYQFDDDDRGADREMREQMEHYRERREWEKQEEEKEENRSQSRAYLVKREREVIDQAEAEIRMEEQQLEEEREKLTEERRLLERKRLEEEVQQQQRLLNEEQKLMEERKLIEAAKRDLELQQQELDKKLLEEERRLLAEQSAMMKRAANLTPPTSLPFGAPQTSKPYQDMQRQGGYYNSSPNMQAPPMPPPLMGGTSMPPLPVPPPSVPPPPVRMQEKVQNPGMSLYGPQSTTPYAAQTQAPNRPQQPSYSEQPSGMATHRGMGPQAGAGMHSGSGLGSKMASGRGIGMGSEIGAGFASGQNLIGSMMSSSRGTSSVQRPDMGSMVAPDKSSQIEPKSGVNFQIALMNTPGLGTGKHSGSTQATKGEIAPERHPDRRPSTESRGRNDISVHEEWRRLKRNQGNKPQVKQTGMAPQASRPLSPASVLRHEEPKPVKSQPIVMTGINDLILNIMSNKD